MKSVYMDQNGKELCRVELYHLCGRIYAMFFRPWGKHKDGEIWRKCILECLSKTNAEEVSTVCVRIRDDEFAPSIVKILKELGFVEGNKRIEYKSEVETLPSDEGTPFCWKKFSEISWTKADLLNFVFLCGEGDPDFDEDENIADDWFENHELTHGPDVISIGYISGEPVAVSVVQVCPADGWSRIPYMGILKESRGKGYGKWVHRRGFSEIKRGGGKIYHGGTVADNTAMIRLFEKHNCKHFADFQQWNLTR